MEILLLVLAVAVLLWGGILMCRGGLLAGALLVILAGCCFGHPFFKVSAGPLPITSDRVLLALLAVQYLVLKRLGRTDPKPLLAADYVLLAFLGLLAASLASHDWRYKSASPVSHYLFLYVLPFVLYWIVRQTRLTERAVLTVFACGGLFAVYLCLTAIFETHGMWSLVFPTYVRSPEFVEFFGRGRGPMLNPAANGFFMGTCLCAGLMWWPRLGRLGQLGVLAVMPLAAWGVYCTFTRSSWLGVALGVLIVVGCSLPRVWRATVMGGILLAATIGVACTWQQFVAFKRDKNMDANEALESAKLRPILARVAWNMFLDRPLWGFGLGQYVPESRAYLHDRTTELNLEKARPFIQHNVFLSLLTETGLLGMGLWILLMTLWAREGWRLWRDVHEPLYARQCGLLMLATIGVYLPNGMFQDVSMMPMFTLLLYFVAGLAIGQRARSAVPASKTARVPLAARQPVQIGNPVAGRS